MWSNNKDEFIHCIWYCMTGTKYNDEVKDSIKILLSNYEDDCLSIIKIYTQTKAKNSNILKFLQKIKLLVGQE